MAEQVNDDEYKKRREVFHAKLLQFHRANNNPIRRFPLLGGKELDLYHLYTKVKSMGGSRHVTHDRLWGEVARSFNLPPSVTSASYACRQNFIKYLEAFERYELGEPVNYEKTNSTIKPLTPLVYSAKATQAQTAPTPVVKNNLSLLTAVPSLNNLLKQLNNNPTLLQQISSMPGLLQLPANQLQIVQVLLQQLAALQSQGSSRSNDSNRFDWLIRSLQCGYPNEVDMAMNTLLTLSFDDNKLPAISYQPQLLSIVLAHTAIFDNDDPGLKLLYDEWYKDGELDFVSFWQEVAPDWVCLVSLSDQSLLERDNMKFEGFPRYHYESIEWFRVTQVAVIVRNLSFNNSNAQFFAQSDVLLKFLFLSVNCYVPHVKACALDTLVNISSFVIIQDGCEHISHLLLLSLYDCVLSHDRHSIMRGVEAIDQLGISHVNEDRLLAIPNEVLCSIFRMLLVPDYQLIQTCLDTLYTLSFYGGRIGEALLDVSNVLISLLTLNVEDMRTDGLWLVHPNGKQEPLVDAMATVSHVEPSKGTPRSASPASVSNHTPTVHAHPTHRAGLPVKLTERYKVGVAAPPTIDKTMESKVTFAVEWLQREYQLSLDEFIPKLDVYSKYLLHCAQLKQINAATQQEFDQIFRTIFPHATMTTVKALGQEIELIAGVGLKKTITTTTTTSNGVMTSSLPSGPKTTHKSSVSSSSSSSSSSSLSPLQQLLQSTKSQNSTKNNSNTQPSPLLYSKKVSSGLKLHRPKINNFTPSKEHLTKDDNNKYIHLNGFSIQSPFNESLARKRQRDEDDITSQSSSKRLYNTINHSRASLSPSNDSLSSKKPPTSPSQSSVRSSTPLSTLSILPVNDIDLPNSTPAPSSSTTSYTCLWEDCLLAKNNFKELFAHIYYDHIPCITSFPSNCLWMNCTSRYKRMKPSLLQHILTHHCSSDPQPVPLNVTETLMKLKLVPSWQSEKESCVTRSLRLTAALVLRNILEKIPGAYHKLKVYESLFANVAFSNNEASFVTSQCLYFLSPPSLNSSKLSS